MGQRGREGDSDGEGGGGKVHYTAVKSSSFPSGASLVS